MFWTFRDDTYAKVTRAYRRPYDDPLEVVTGDRVVPDHTKSTDMFGWVWCRAGDGREGWTPQAWLGGDDGDTMLRDFCALELTVTAGQRVRLIHAESGFVWCEDDGGGLGWLPDAVLVLE